MIDRHIVSAFDKELDLIQTAVARIGAHVQIALHDASASLKSHDLQLADKVLMGDAAIDALVRQVKIDAAKLLALRAPTAGDLRIVLTVLDIASHLERCGDYAKNIAKRVSAIPDQGGFAEVTGELLRMARFVERMTTDALKAYIDRDTAKALEVINRDIEADEMHNNLFRELLTHMMEDQRKIVAGMHLHFVAKNIERVGDHATGIAEQTLYLVTGALPDEERPKADRTALSATPGQSV